MQSTVSVRALTLHAEIIILTGVSGFYKATPIFHWARIWSTDLFIVQLLPLALTKEVKWEEPACRHFERLSPNLYNEGLGYQDGGKPETL